MVQHDACVVGRVGAADGMGNQVLMGIPKGPIGGIGVHINGWAKALQGLEA